MNEPNTEDRLAVVRRELAAQRQEYLALPPEKTLARILDHPQPAALVHSFTEEDFFFLLQEIGADDARPLLALGSHRQLEYVLDQQIWDRDRIELQQLFAWMERFVATEPDRMVRWLAAEKANLVAYYLSQSIAVRMREHDQDPADFGPHFFSFDNVFYVRTLDFPSTESPGEDFQKRHHQLVRRILERLANDDYIRYQSMLLTALNVLPAETEEEAYRLRNVRLAEKGFVPFEEAVGLYQPLGFDRFQKTHARFQRLSPAEDTRLPLAPLAMLAGDDLFRQALRTFAPGGALDQVQSEFASLCNRITVADRVKIERRDDLHAVVDKACSYLSIGLQRLTPEAPAAAARNLAAFTLEGLFRLGYSQAVHLKQEAERWVAASWFARNGLPLTFWGEAWLGVVGGLLLKRPLYFESGPRGHHYREFSSLDEVHAGRRELTRIRAVDQLLARMPLELPPARRYGHLTYKSVLLTLWARSELGLGRMLQPIGLERFRRFWESLFAARSPESAGGRPLADGRRRAFAEWLARQSGHTAEDLAAAIGPVLEDLFTELGEEYGRVSSEAIDPRYLTHFLLNRDDAGAQGDA
jgi:hypothetical protein